MFSLKVKLDGTLNQYKAHLVALDFKQEHGIDYKETFVPVAKMTIVRTLVGVTGVRHWPLWQKDVKKMHFSMGTYMRQCKGNHHLATLVHQPRSAI